MNSVNKYIEACNTSETLPGFPKNIEDYTEILNFYGLEYKRIDYCLQIGEINQVQGWILHISVVISQTLDLFKTIIPVLIKEKVSFKIAEDKQTCLNLLNGTLGIAQIGKIVSIYPTNDQEAFRLSKQLIDITKLFRGPRIPTDALLGNIVYTRYGSFNPILQPDNNGKKEKYIYNKKGELIKDPYSIPFRLPDGISCPFPELIENTTVQKSKNLKSIYRPVSFLKEDPRGNVFKGVYLQKWFLPKPCIIKQGKKDMYSDDWGRDISDRLIWQQDLHKKLSGIVPLPKVIDFFRQDEDGYLVIEYIKGKSLYDEVKKVNSESTSWFDLPPQKALWILDTVLHIISIIEKLHENGIVHRDIVPVNFMIDKKKRVYLIDLELAYSLPEMRPTPPFDLGTPGFMSPEQQNILQPTVKEDIYALGGLLLETFTGLTPVKLNMSSETLLREALTGLLQNRELGNLIADCLHPLPGFRPELIAISKTLHQNKNKLTLKGIRKKIKLSIESAQDDRIKELISSAVNGLIKPPIVLQNGLWYSKMFSVSNHSSSLHRDYIRYVGLAEGISGVLYLLARVNRIGMNIAPCINNYKKGWDYIYGYYDNPPKGINPGFYTGSTGVALALCEGLNSGLIDKNTFTSNYLQNLLSSSAEDICIANGFAGQGITLLACSQYLPEEMVKTKLDNCIEHILNKQERDGSWKITQPEKKEDHKLSFGYGNTGVIWFLLEYISCYPNEQVKESTLKGLSWLLKNISSLKKSVTTDNQKGALLTLIKAYECLQLENCKKIAEKILHRYPNYTVSNDFSQKSGLAGMGELYLEAARVFKNEEWQRRVNWIVNIFLYTFNKTEKNSGYWKMEEVNDPTADLMLGNSGIIHFLARYTEPQKLGYRLLK
jgi:serine/threonine protein kinase